ncbi:hypothetical protein HMPREF1084_02351 [Clostridium butyricum 60E.3]|nr:hypothetical protein NPD4_4230 [Clostridium butyricum]ENZ32680.1 hypothetical protein HMPREF1084_02351 [Clostridium butyricum 60E.3]
MAGYNTALLDCIIRYIYENTYILCKNIRI